MRELESNAHLNRRDASALAFSTYLLISLIAGYALAINFPSLRDYAGCTTKIAFVLFAIRITLGIVEAKFDFLSQKTEALLKSIFACFICMLFAFGYYFWRTTPNPYPNFVPRELSCACKIIDVSHGVNESLYGIAQIVESPENYPLLNGRKVWFTISDGKGGLRQPIDVIQTQVLKFNGTLSPVFMNSSAFGWQKEGSDKFANYLLSRGIDYKVFSNSTNVESRTDANWLFEKFHFCSRYISSQLSKFPFGLSSDSTSARTYRAMVLGDKSLLTSTQKTTFARTGIMHVFAVSGLHIGFAASVFYFITGFFRLNFRTRMLIVIPLLLMYVGACGCKPSAIRAFGMICVVWLAMSLMRSVRVYDALILTAFITLVIFPTDFTDAGFALSYCITASIFAYSTPLFKELSDRFRPRICGLGYFSKLIFSIKQKAFDFIVGGICISFGCTIAAFPLSAHYFGYASLLSFIYSPLYVLGAGCVVSLGLIAVILPAFVGQFFNFIAYGIVWTMDNSAQYLFGMADMSLDYSIMNGAISGLAVIAFLFVASLLCAGKNKGLLGFFIAPLVMFSIITISEIFYLL